MSDLVTELKAAWSQFDSAALDRLENLYDPHVHFIDPAGEIRGRDALMAHLRHQCRELLECRFEFDELHETRGEGRACLVWNMILRHRKINGGRETVTRGISLLELDRTVTFHRDWFDLGEMVYEHVPLVGSVVGMIKSKLRYNP